MSDQLIHFLAPARIARYRQYLKLSTNEEVYRAYQWNYEIAAVVFPLLGCIEMHMRDAIHREMAKKYAPAATPNVHAYAWYDWTLPQHFPLKLKARDDVEKILYNKKTGLKRNPAPTTDDVVASLTFGFWTNLIRSISPVDAPKIIPQVFPHHHVITHSHWGNVAVRESLNGHLRVANDFRNRVAHHEPLFKFRYGGYPKNLKRGLINLQDCVDKCLTISEWVDPAARASLEASAWYLRFRELATLDSFASWTKVGPPKARFDASSRCAEYATKNGLTPP